MKQKQIIETLQLSNNTTCKDYSSKLAKVYEFLKVNKACFCSVELQKMGNVELVKTLKPINQDLPKALILDRKLKQNNLKALFGEFIEWAKIRVKTVSGDYAFDLPTNNDFYTCLCDLLGLEIVKTQKVKAIETIQIQGDLMPYIKKALAFVSHDDLSPAMTCVCLDFSDGWVNCVSTDAHRLYLSPKFKTDFQGEKQILLADLKAAEIKASKDIECITLVETFEGNKGQINGVKFNILDARYPDYKAVIPQDYENTMLIDSQTLQNSIKSVYSLSNKSTSQVNISIGENLKFQCQDVDFCFEGETECNYLHNTIPDMQIGFNARFLLECLRELKSTVLAIELSTPTKAALIKNEKETILLMPLMLNN